MPGITVLRETIIAALVTRLGTIRTANGYWSDMGAAGVSQWETAPNPPWGQDELPACSVKDPECQVFELSEDEVVARVKMSVEILIGCLGGSTAHVTMRQLISDVYRCIGLMPNLGVTSVTAVRREGDSMQSEQQDKIAMVGTVTLGIEFMEDQFPTT